jgi:hypothetical protein
MSRPGLPTHVIFHDHWQQLQLGFKKASDPQRFEAALQSRPVAGRLGCFPDRLLDESGCCPLLDLIGSLHTALLSLAVKVTPNRSRSGLDSRRSPKSICNNFPEILAVFRSLLIPCCL